MILLMRTQQLFLILYFVLTLIFSRCTYKKINPDLILTDTLSSHKLYDTLIKVTTNVLFDKDKPFEIFFSFRTTYNATFSAG